MTSHPDLHFPSDRSLLPRAAGRTSVSVLHPIDAAGVNKQKIGFAALFVFSRLLQQERLQVCLQDAGEASHLSVEINPEKTLIEALGLCRRSALSSVGRIGLTIITPSDPNRQIVMDEPVLSFALHEKEAVFSIDFDPTLLAPVSARDFLEKMFLVIDALAAAPQTRCADLELVTSTARTLIPDLSRAIVVDHFPSVAVTFFQVAEMYPVEPAITDGTRWYTYADLARMVRHLTVRLMDAGLVQGDIVAISGPASFGVYASMLAVMAAGGVLVTIDQSLPMERQNLIESISRPRLRIKVGRSGVMMAGERAIVTPDWPTSAEIAAVPDKPTCVVDLAADAPAYVFFTSGSSGVPKGVLGAHLGLAHFLAWQRDSFPIGPGDRMAQLIALSFDPVLRDVLYPLTSGACLYVPARAMLFDARRMVAWFETQAITAMHCVPSLMKAWLQATPPGRPFATMRHAFFNGEPLTDFLLRRFMAAAGPETRIINLYGPTETTLAKVSRTIERIEPGVQPIGTPQAGVDVAIIVGGTRCGLWEIGEIAIRTPYRSKGYLDNPELTAQAFVVNPLRNDPHDLIYFTGDLGRVRSDGVVEIFGRNDTQFKVHGVRIEPNEIESAMLDLPGVADAAVMLREGAMGEKVLVGLVVSKDAIPDAERTGFVLRIRDALRNRLSYAMVPSRISLCDVLPYLPNGKLDRKALAELEIDPPLAQAVPAHHSRTGDERLRRLVTGLEETLGVRIDSLNSTFLDLGGDSLSYIRASMLIEDLLGWLPPGWEKKPLAEFPAFWQGPDASTQSDARRWGGPLVGMEVSVLLRAVSIVLVVLSHSSFTEVVTATSTLFVISGMNFSRFLRPAIRSAGNVWPTLKLILKFAIPAGLWQVPRSISMDSWWLPNLFLLGTLFQNPARPLVTPWFLDVLAVNLILFALISWIAYRFGARHRSRRELGRNSFKGDFAWVLVGIVAAAIQVISGWWDGKVGTDSVAPFKWFWMLALGVLVMQADSTARRARVSVLLFMLAVAAYSGIEWAEAVLHMTDAFFFLSVAMLVWVERIRVPRRLHRPIMVVASATLFIYLVNYTVIMHVMPKMHLPPWWPLEVCVAIISGIVAKLLWDFVSGQTMHLAARFQRILRRS